MKVCRDCGDEPLTEPPPGLRVTVRHAARLTASAGTHAEISGPATALVDVESWPEDAIGARREPNVRCGVLAFTPESLGFTAADLAPYLRGPTP